MEFLVDDLLRFATIGLLAGLACVFAKSSGESIQGKLGCLLAVSLAAFLLIGTAELQAASPTLVALVTVLAIPNFPLLFLFGTSLFDDDFHIASLSLAACGSYIFAFALLSFGGEQLPAVVSIIGELIITFGSLVFMFVLLWTAWSGRNDDLVDSRRRARTYFVVILGLAGLTAVVFQNIILRTGAMTAANDYVPVLVVFPVAFGALLWITPRGSRALLFETEKIQSVEPTVDPALYSASRRLAALVEEERVLLTPGLTLRGLAEQVEIPEHQLRKLINQQLGFRSFSKFINAHRLEYAKAVMGNPEEARLPILTIAMDAGYNSLSTFNRVFKEAERQTPTEFRKAALAQATLHAAD